METIIPEMELDIILLPYVNGVKKVAQYFNDNQMMLEQDEQCLLNNNSLVLNSLLQHRDLDYGLATDQVYLFNGQYLHEEGYLGENMLIAVIDGGFRGADKMQSLQPLFEDDRIVAVRNMVNRKETVFSAANHGSAVLSTMACVIDNTYMGVAPRAEYILIVSEDVSSEQLVEEFNYVQSLEFADSLGVDVVNTSLGYTTFNDPLMNHDIEDLNGDQALATRAADVAASKGILVVNSAGNLGNKEWQFISVPADGDSVLAVGAVDKNGSMGKFSSRGYLGHLNVKPNIVAMGVQTAIVNGQDSVIYSNGTSFSSPLISGMAACLWQANPQRTNMEIFRAIEESADQYLNPDNAYGYGIPDFKAAQTFLTISDKNYDLNDNELLVFPNPFQHDFTIRLKEDITGPISYEVFNDLGQRVDERIDINDRGLLLHCQFNEASQAAGIYIMRLKTKNKTYTSRLLKMRDTIE